MIRLAIGRRMWRAWLAALVAGLLALAAPWLDRLRPVPLERQARYELHVTSGADAGIGTLREAIFTADRADRRVRIVIETPRIAVSTPLPPVINPNGVVLDAQPNGTLLDVTSAPGSPVLDISAPNTVVSRLRIACAGTDGILVRARGARFDRVDLRGCASGIYFAETADELTVQDSDFDGNLVGIHLPSTALQVSILRNRFRRHSTAAVWAVAASEPAGGVLPSIDIYENRFESDERSLVLMNVAGRVERNSFLGARAVAVLITGATSIVRANRVRSGRGFGINAEALNRGLIANNEIDHNCAGGILVRAARNTQVVSNRLYANGYGIVMVLGGATSPNMVADNLVLQHFEDGLYVIGGSPVIRRNRLLDNRQAGLRLSVLRLEGNQRAVPEPLLDANVVGGNGRDAFQRDEYRPSAASVPPGGSRDCSWRAGEESAAIAPR